MLVGANHHLIGESKSGNSWLLDNGLSVSKYHEDCSWRWLRLDELESKSLAETGIPRDCQLQADKNHSGQRWAKTKEPVDPIPLVDNAAETGVVGYKASSDHDADLTMDLEVPAQADTTAACKDVSVTGAQSIAFADNLENAGTRRSTWRPQSLLLRAPCDKLLVQCWHKLEVFAGSRGSLQQLREPRDKSAKEWTKGVNTASSTRLLRVLLPVRSFLEMLRVDISVPSDMGSIVAPHARLSGQQVFFCTMEGMLSRI